MHDSHKINETFGSKVPAEQAGGDMDLLPHEEIPIAPIGTAAEKLNGEDDGVFGSVKCNITVMDDISSYSP
jgi:hypothetical protein